MQSLTGGSRSGFTAAQITDLLTSETVRVSAGLRLLNSNLQVVADISDDLVGGTVSRDMLANVHGTCALDISRVLSWGVDLVQPYVTLSSGQVAGAVFDVGVFCLTTPDNAIHDSPQQFSVTGYDRLYLLNRPVGDTYSVAAGTGVLSAVTSVITAAGLSGVLLDGTSSASTVPTDRTWPLVPAQTATGAAAGATTWLNIVNDLLDSIGYRGLYTDEGGLFRSQPYVDPASRAPEFTFDTDSTRSIVGLTRHQKYDVWATPNSWVFIQQNRDPALAAPTNGDGIYTFTNQSSGPTSVDARGLKWVKVVQVDAANQAALVTRANVTIAADRRTTELLSVDTGIFPVAGHADVFTFHDPVLGADRKVQAMQWRLDLLGADTQWQWQAIPS